MKVWKLSGKKVVQGLEGIREEKLYIEIIYYIKHLDEIRTCQNILNSKDKL